MKKLFVLAALIVVCVVVVAGADDIRRFWRMRQM